MSKTTITSSQIKHVAQLSKLPLTPERSQKLQPQLSEVLDYVSQIGSLDTKKTAETCQVTDHQNTFREDKIDSLRVLTQKQALSGTSNTHRGYIVVGALIDKT